MGFGTLLMVFNVLGSAFSLGIQRCKPNEQFPHEFTCTRYYICRNGIRVPVVCGIGKYYHPQLRSCGPLVDVATLCPFDVLKEIQLLRESSQTTTTTTTTTTSTTSTPKTTQAIIHKPQQVTPNFFKNTRKKPSKSKHKSKQPKSKLSKSKSKLSKHKSKLSKSKLKLSKTKSKKAKLHSKKKSRKSSYDEEVMTHKPKRKTKKAKNLKPKSKKSRSTKTKSSKKPTIDEKPKSKRKKERRKRPQKEIASSLTHVLPEPGSEMEAGSDWDSDQMENNDDFLQ